MNEVAIVSSLFLGLLIGSFLNVVIYRIPEGKSIVSPRSACPSCNRQLPWYENIPIVSWLVLRGKCSNCGSKISARYLVVEVLTGLIFATTTYSILTLNPNASAESLLELIGLLIFFSAGITLAFIDLDHFRLPTKIIILAGSSILAIQIGLTILSGDSERIFSAVLGGVALYAFFGLVHLLVPGGMGRGDVNLAGLIGLQLGWFGVGVLLVGAFLGFALGALFGIALILAAGGNRKTKIPFGPWMILGSWLGLLIGQQIWLWYLELNGIFA